ncbi:hypothetical protein SODALDRAFT_345480 [Sodiomyces alkalinus F11]|uniref:Mid2 domain-containing protein n=1 Tax=Sodiomyces alkalinus (strain CBS 110278 / VKM F-3762 / F11) TaxID=1314773 RepID=A0A3N2PQK5_SODAK|nr:hypothetical protein SODALDRAFT_345480 [Sodiomyces alkalinus F11]ROT36792.1 hypothetical protein SODALDRAFT_345480 [Sodiomyces alkalinus F11]
MSRSRARVLLLVWLASARAASIPSIFQRDDTAICGADNFRQCGGGLDEGLCCAEGRTCLFLAGGSTVVCCPNDSCKQFTAISCNVSLQDPSEYPQRQLKTTALDAELPRCGENCCPFGYTCNDEGLCDMDEDQSQRPSERPASERPSTTRTSMSSVTSTSIISTTTSSSESTTSGTTTSTSTSASTPTGDADDEEDDPFPTAPVVVGVLAGVFLLVAAAVAVFMYLARRRNKKKNATSAFTEKKPFGRGRLFRASSSTSSFGHIISDPIPREESALRTDFILKTPERHSRASQRLSSLSRRDSLNLSGATAVRGARPPRIPTRTLTNATMTTTNRHNPRPSITIPPIRTMRNQQKPTINQGGYWGDGGLAPREAALEAATPTDTRPVTPRLQREPSSESINVFADPGTVASSSSSSSRGGQQGNPSAGVMGLEPPQMKRFTSGTTFTDLMEEAQLGDVRRGNPFVPGTPGRTPQRG